MALNNIVTSVYKKSWTRVNNFSVELFPTDAAFRNAAGWDISPEDFTLALKSIDTPAYQNNVVEMFTGNEWRFNNGRDEMFQYTMTFRDFDQMKIYSSFVNLYNLSKDNYFDKIKLNVTIYLDDEVGVNKKPLFKSSDTIVSGISQLQFAHDTENQIAEFSVDFKCSSPLHKGYNSESVAAGGVTGAGPGFLNSGDE